MKNLQPTYSVDVEKEALIFSAAHFITFGDNICEALHGHNYRVRCRVTGPLNEHGYVVDFIAVRDRLRELVHELDHHVLLALEHPTILIDSSCDAEIVVTFEDRRWVFPRSDCALLPIANTTAELLATYLGRRLTPLILEISPQSISMEVGVDENEGQWGNAYFQF